MTAAWTTDSHTWIRCPSSALRTLGYGTLAQVTWIYNRAVNIEGLRRFHHNLGYGLLGRRIEQSPLPFARDRWVVSRGPADIEIAAAPRPRAELNTWAYQRACLPVDPEMGPAGTSGCCRWTTTARQLAWSRPTLWSTAWDCARRSPTQSRAGCTIWAIPHLVRAPADAPCSKTAARPSLRRRNWHVHWPRWCGWPARDVGTSPHRSRRRHLPPVMWPKTQPAVVPTLSAYVDLAQWDACAKRLGGTSNSLFAGFAARLGVRLGRQLDDRISHPGFSGGRADRGRYPRQRTDLCFHHGRPDAGGVRPQGNPGQSQAGTG